MRSASRAHDLARRLHRVSCRRCRLWPCVRVSPLLPCVLSAAVGVAAAIRVVCGHAGRCRCGCRLRPWVLSPSRVSSVAVGVAAAAIRIVCGRACCRHRRASRCGRARCCCGPRVSPPPPCASSAAVNVAAAAARVVCGRECCRCCGACRLWPCASPLWAVRVAPGPTVQSCNRKKKVSEKEKNKKQKHPHRRRQIAAAGCACRLRPCMSPPPCMSLRPCALLLRAMRITAARVICGRACRSWAYSTVM